MGEKHNHRPLEGLPNRAKLSEGKGSKELHNQSASSPAWQDKRKDKENDRRKDGSKEEDKGITSQIR